MENANQDHGEGKQAHNLESMSSGFTHQPMSVINTKCPVSLVDAKIIGIPIKNLFKNPITLYDSEGQSCQIIGTVKIALHFKKGEGLRIIHEFKVAKDLPFECILGDDFCHRHGFYVEDKEGEEGAQNFFLHHKNVGEGWTIESIMRKENQM